VIRRGGVTLSGINLAANGGASATDGSDAATHLVPAGESISLTGAPHSKHKMKHG
jgi:hypothetical protein